MQLCLHSKWNLNRTTKQFYYVTLTIIDNATWGNSFTILWCYKLPKLASFALSLHLHVFIYFLTLVFTPFDILFHLESLYCCFCFTLHRFILSYLFIFVVFLSSYIYLFLLLHLETWQLLVNAAMPRNALTPSIAIPLTFFHSCIHDKPQLNLLIYLLYVSLTWNKSALLFRWWQF